MRTKGRVATNFPIEMHSHNGPFSDQATGGGGKASPGEVVADAEFVDEAQCEHVAVCPQRQGDHVARAAQLPQCGGAVRNHVSSG